MYLTASQALKYGLIPRLTLDKQQQVEGRSL